MALTTARISSSRWRPPGLGGGIKSLIRSHSASVRSVGYGFAVIPPVYRTEATYGRLFKQPLSLSRPGRTALSPRHDVLPGACQGPGCAAPRSEAARPRHVPSGTRCVLDNNSTNRAARGQAGTELPGVHRDIGHGGRSVVPR